MIYATVTVGICILIIEGVLWLVFRKKVDGICFPNEADHSHLRFFSLTRIRLIALLHTVILLAILIFSTLLLW